MKKSLKRIILCCLLMSVFWLVSLTSDRNVLKDNLIRFHVVANSDSSQDQTIKLQVRDAVLKSIESDMRKIADINEAKAYLQENLPRIQQVVNYALEKTGFDGGSQVSLCTEPFDIRHYDTFSLPAGVYHSLRIVIGDGLGQNWWCVSFPALCIPATTSGFLDAAVGAGFSEPLAQAISGNEDYKIRFYFLDQLGKLENILLLE